MSPILFGVAVVFTVVPLAVSQCTTSRCAERGYEPPRWENGALYLETLLSETSNTLLKAVEARLVAQSEAMETRLVAQSEAMETRLEAQSDTMETRLTAQSQAAEKLAKAFDDRFASFEKTINTRMDAFQESQDNGTTDIASGIQHLAEQTTGIETHSDDQLETLKELAKAIDDRFASLEETFNTRMEESNANETNDITAKMQEQSTVLETRLAQQEVYIKAHLTRIIDEKYETLTDTLEDSRENGTLDIAFKVQRLAEQSIGLEVRSAEHSEAMKELAKAMVDRFASLEETLNTRINAFEESKSKANGTNEIATKMQALGEKTVALETRLDRQEDSIKAHLTKTIDERYKSLTESLEESIRNGTCALVPKIQRLAEQSMAVEARLTQLEGAITTNLTRTIDGRCENMTATLAEVTDGFNRRVDALQEIMGNRTKDLAVNFEEIMVTEMRKLANIAVQMLRNDSQAALTATENQLQSSLAPSIIAIPDIMPSTEMSYSSRSSISDLEDTSEPTTETYTTLGTSASEFLPGQTVVFLRRMDGSVNFTRPWAEYKAGFGDRGAEFWLGLDTLHALTTQRQYKLRVELTDWSGERKWEVYNHFSVGGEGDKYRLRVYGYDRSVSITRYNYLLYNNGHQFTTIDRDNDPRGSVNCAIRDKGGWWYRCGYNNPTGVYRPAGYTGYGEGDGGIMWGSAYADYRPFKELTLKLIPV